MVRVVAAVAAGLMCSGCTQLTAGTATSAAPENTPAYKAQRCEQLHSDRWIEVPGSAPGDPKVRIAQPPGWDPAPELATETIKLVLRNVSLSDGVTNPVVTVATGDTTEGSRTPEDLLGDSLKGIEVGGGRDITHVPAEVCGFPALMANYTVPADDGGKTIYVTGVTVMVPHGSKVWNVIALAQSTAPNNPTFMADAQVMLAGLRIAVPR